MVPGLLVAALALALAAPAAAAPRPVLVTGDSLVRPLDHLMVPPVERTGGRVVKDPRPGTGLTRPIILDWERHARRQTRRHRQRATVVFIGAGDTEPMTSATGPRVACCRRAWIDAYADLVEQMMRTYMRDKRRHVYWLTLPAPRQRERRQQFLAINYAIGQAALRAGAKTHVVDTVPALSPNNEFRRTRIYRGKRVVVRHGDGVHLTTAGSRIARDLVVRAMRRDGVLVREAVADAAQAPAATASLVYEEPLPELDIPAAYSLTVEGAGVAANRIGVGERNGGFTVTDASGSLRAGPGCSNVSARQVRCLMSLPAGDRSVFVDAGDGADKVALGGVASTTVAEARGGGGPDLIFGSTGDDALTGSGGNDILIGGPGIDLLDGAAGNDILGGGPGRDAVSYQRRRRPVTVDLARQQGGRRGERDLIVDVEGVIGTRGADILRGSRASDTLVGGEGTAHDRLNGRAGDDGLIGYRSFGGRGADVLDARRPTCGRGADVIFRRTHIAPGPFARACERLIAIFIVLRPRPVRTSRDGAVFEVRCERVGPCRGAFELRDSEGVIARRRFSLTRRANSTAMREVRVPFGRRPAERVASLHISGVRAFQASQLRVRLR